MYTINIDNADLVGSFCQAMGNEDRLYKLCRGLLVKKFIEAYKRFPLSFDCKKYKIEKTSSGLTIKFDKSGVKTREL